MSGKRESNKERRETRLCLAASNSFYLGPDLDLDIDPDLDLDHDPDLGTDFDPDLVHFQFWSFCILAILYFGHLVFWS